MKKNELIALADFSEAGCCTLDPGLNSGVRFALNRYQDERVIYAFVDDDEVKYIGVCNSTNTCFAHRMNRYQGMMGAGTNRRIVELIRGALSAGHSVTIFVWRPEQQLQVGELRVDLVKGLENPLIALARPEWNIHG